MSGTFEWVPDLTPGEWLRPMEAEPLGSVLSIVPGGFEAYARIFHPLERDRPRATKTWQGIDEATYFAGVEDIEASLETERATWAKAAASFGTIMHAEAQYGRIVRRDRGSSGGAIAADGWRYGDARVGCLDGASLAAASVVLARHTVTPDAGIAAMWEGWGGLVSSAGVAYFTFEPDDGLPARHSGETAAHGADPLLRERLVVAVGRGFARVRSMFEALSGPLRDEPAPGTGLLAREIAVGPRFDLHGSSGRSYVLFEAGAGNFATAVWPGLAPWADEVLEPQSPSILWPDDHSWVLATEIDFDSTLVAGTSALISELSQTPGLEVLPISTGSNLTWGGRRAQLPHVTLQHVARCGGCSRRFPS